MPTSSSSNILNCVHQSWINLSLNPKETILKELEIIQNIITCNYLKINVRFFSFNIIFHNLCLHSSCSEFGIGIICKTIEFYCSDSNSLPKLNENSHYTCTLRGLSPNKFTVSSANGF